MSERERFTAYITKYALTSGIRAVLVETNPYISTAIDVANPKTYFHGNEWHRTTEAAVKRAEAMRLAKLASLEKQAAKLRKLKFV